MMKKLPTKNDVKDLLEMSLRPPWRIGIVYSSFYKEEIDTMLNGAMHLLKECGIEEANITLHPAPGSFEIPLIGSALAKADAVDALIGLGIIVEGQTHHARLIAEETASGIMQVQLQHHIPFAFEVLYIDSLDLAVQRLHKGEEAALSVLQSLCQLHEIPKAHE